MFIKFMLLIFSKEDFTVAPKYITYFIGLNNIISNLTVFSDFKTTDIVLSEVLKQQNNFFKILTLYSARNKLNLEVDKFFSINAYLTSLWLAAQVNSKWHITSKAHENLNKWLSDPEVCDKYVLSAEGAPIMEEPCFTYFHSTYAAPGKDKLIRKSINKRIKEDFKFSFSLKSPDFSKILVISRSLTKGHAVYKSISPMLYSLKESYKLDLFHLYNEEENIDDKLFDNIRLIKIDSVDQSFKKETLEEYLKENYGIVIFTDIGLSRPSIILANLRLAPIQITTYGHPVSTNGTEIDYYIGGQDVEIGPEAQEFYSEQLVLIPGSAVNSIYPNYTRKFPDKNKDAIQINCSWGNQKFSYPHLITLKKIIEKTKKKIIFNFIGMHHDCFLLPTAEFELAEILGKENIRISKEASYPDYMKLIEESHFAIDSYPFGSYNRIIDNLFCGLPVVTLEGKLAYNRLASQILRDAELSELIATSDEEFVSKTVKLIEDDSYRAELTKKIESMDIKKKLMQSGNEKYFRKAIDYIVANHNKLKQKPSKQAIIIDKD